MNFESLKQSKLSQTKEKEFVLNSRATGPKSGRGPGRQRPSWPGSRGAWPARNGLAAYSHGLEASKVGLGAAADRRLERARERSWLAQHPAVRT
jgi:hypothetical protein